MTLKELGKKLDGQVFGDSEVEVFNVSSIDFPKTETIVHIEKEKQVNLVLKSPATALLLSDTIPIPKTHKTILQVKDGKSSFIALLKLFNNVLPPSEGIHPTAILGDNVIIGDGVCIMAYCDIQDEAVIESDVIIYPHSFIGSMSHIGKETILYSRVTIERGSILGKRNIISSGVVLGSDGFGYYDDIMGERHKIPQVGIVETGDDVEIGANTTIDRATIDKTCIGSNTKIDNLVQIGHNCIIGEDCYIAGQTGIAGSVRIGNRVTLAGQVGIVDHIVLEDDVVVLARSVVTHSIKKGVTVLGYPAKPVKEAKRILASLSRLPKIMESFKKTGK